MAVKHRKIDYSGLIEPLAVRVKRRNVSQPCADFINCHNKSDNLARNIT